VACAANHAHRSHGTSGPTASTDEPLYLHHHGGAVHHRFVLLAVGCATELGLGLMGDMSFPMAAFTTLTLRMSQEHGGAWLQLPATLLLAVTSLLILGLTLGTWRGLRHGHLLVPNK
jgi:hypothetical protein